MKQDMAYDIFAMHCGKAVENIYTRNQGQILGSSAFYDLIYCVFKVVFRLQLFILRASSFLAIKYPTTDFQRLQFVLNYNFSVRFICRCHMTFYVVITNASLIKLMLI